MNRRQFLGLSGLSAAVLALGPAVHHQTVPDRACHGKNIPARAAIGDCYVLTRGTYAGPSVPDSAKPFLAARK